MIDNNSQLIGRLTKDPQMNHVEKDGQRIEVCNMTIAVDKRGKRGTNFIPLVAWRKTAILCMEHLQKGSLIALNGELDTNSYKDGGGKWHNNFAVVIDEVRFLDRYKKAGAAQDAVDAADDIDPTAAVDPTMFE